MKALDFSLDNDDESDENESYTHASLQKEKFPPSFTICTAFKMAFMDEYGDAVLFVLRDNKGSIWHLVDIYAMWTYTEFSFQFGDYYRFFEAKVVIGVEESFKTEDFNGTNFSEVI